MSVEADASGTRTDASSTSIMRNALHLVTGQVATTALSIALTAVVGRTLGAADFGLLYLVTSMSTFAYVFVDWGQGVYIIREVSRGHHRAGELLGSSIALRVVGSAAVCGPTVLIAWLLDYDARTCQLAAVLIVASLPLFVVQGYGQVFRGRERMDYDALLTVLGKGLTLAITLPALALGGRLLAVILAQGAAGLGALTVAVFLFRRLRLPPLRAAFGTARELGVGGTPFFAMLLGITAQAYIDAIVISKLAPPAAVGWYGAARNIINTLITPAAILGAASFPRLSRAALELPQFKHEFRTAIRPLLGLGTLGSVGTFLFADVAVGVVYGKDRFGPAAAILQVFSPSLLLFFMGVVLGNGIVALGKPRQLATGKVFSILVSTGLGIILVPICQARFGNGGIGLVIAFASGELLMVALALVLIPRGTLDRGLLLDLGRALAAGGGTLLLVEQLPRMSPALGIPTCVLAFSALAVAVGLVSRNDLALLAAVLGRRTGGATGSGRGR